MATIDIGKIKPVFKGTYDNSTAYVLDDIVYYNGSSYVAKTSTTGNLPTDTTKWNILASGSGGIWDSTLSIGSANQILQVNSGATALEFTTKPEGGLVQTATAVKTDVYSSTTTGSWNDVDDMHVSLTSVGANSHKAIGNIAFAWGTSTSDTVSNFRIRKTIDNGSNWTVLHEHGSSSGGAGTFRGQTMGLRSMLDNNGGNYTNLAFFDTAIGTTGTVKYQLQQRRTQSGTFYINRTANDGTSYGRGACQLWVMEVKV